MKTLRLNHEYENPDCPACLRPEYPRSCDLGLVDGCQGLLHGEIDETGTRHQACDHCM